MYLITEIQMNRILLWGGEQMQSDAWGVNSNPRMSTIPLIYTLSSCLTFSEYSDDDSSLR